jgi:predicted translin family RNA/ssDNA-binding protein
MTDDIVTRLRGQACPECGLPSTHNQFDEAADEIEKLRKELEIYKDLYAREAVERTMVEQVKESAHWVAGMMNKGNVNPKDVYPKGRYSGD